MIDSFSSLLQDPPGTYALTPFGSTHAIVLTGCPTFRERGYNLFTSMGGKAHQPLPPLHSTDRVDTVWFCTTADAARMALALYLYGRLWRTNMRAVVDDEGDFVECVCDNEAELWTQAEQLACDFIVSHMRPDHRALPTYEGDTRTVEHGLGTIGVGHDSD